MGPSLFEWIQWLHSDPHPALQLLEKIVGWTRRRVPISNDTADLVQEVVMRLLDGAGDEPRTDLAFQPWARKITLNLCLEEHRRQRRCFRWKCSILSRACISTPPDPGWHEDASEALELMHSASARFKEPYHTIAREHLLGPQSWSELLTTLQDRRTVGIPECRRLLRATKEMLQCAREGGDPESRWPQRFLDRLANRWSNCGLSPEPREKKRLCGLRETIPDHDGSRAGTAIPDQLAKGVVS